MRELNNQENKENAAKIKEGDFLHSDLKDFVRQKYTENNRLERGRRKVNPK